MSGEPDTDFGRGYTDFAGAVGGGPGWRSWAGTSAADPGDGYTDAQLWTGAYTEACSLISYGGLVVLDHKQIVVPPEERHDPSHFPYDVYLPRVAAWVAWLRGLPPAELGRYCL